MVWLACCCGVAALVLLPGFVFGLAVAGFVQVDDQAAVSGPAVAGEVGVVQLPPLLLPPGLVPLWRGFLVPGPAAAGFVLAALAGGLAGVGPAISQHQPERALAFRPAAGRASAATGF